MDEYDGHLRVAYTRTRAVDAWGSSVTENGVDVLRVEAAAWAALPADAPAGSLERIGRVDGLGLTERIYAVRFMGARGYLVTFRRTDPFYTLDLSDPASPTMLGELKITGYSDYIHSVDRHTLLGVGRAGDEDGRIAGVKLALFNVSDPCATDAQSCALPSHPVAAPRLGRRSPRRARRAEPTQIASLELGGGSSSTLVEDDHRALLFDARRNLLVLPITERESGWADCGQQPPTFHGAKLFTLGADGFTQQAAIEHGPNRTEEGRWRDGAGSYYAGCSGSAPCAAAAVRRSLYIGDELYTLSDSQLRATDLNTFAPTWSSPLFERQTLARNGTCSLDGAAVPWDRVAASADYNCGSRSCPDADDALREATCATSAAWQSWRALLGDARTCCGTQDCRNSCPVEYNDCINWF
jgi:hypothetical protein